MEVGYVRPALPLTPTRRQSIHYCLRLIGDALWRQGARAPLLRRLRHGLHGEGVELAAAVARAAHHENRGLVEYAVQGAQQRVVPGEERRPVLRHGVAGEYHGVGTLLLVSPVHHVEEQVGAGLVELTAADLVDDEAGRLHEGPDDARGVAPPDRGRQPVPELARLDVVRLEPPQAALAAVRLTEVRLSVM